MSWHITEFNGGLQLHILEPYYSQPGNKYAVNFITFSSQGAELVNEIEYFDTLPQALTFFNEYRKNGFFDKAMSKANKTD